MFGTKKQQPADDSIELVGLDVRFVSGVGTPATGEKFLLYKAADGKPEDCADDEKGEKPESDAEEADEKSPKKKKKGQEAAWTPPIAATSDSENGPEVKKGDQKKYTWAACMRDNAGEKDPSAVCANLARKVSSDSNKTAKSGDFTGQDILLPADADLVALLVEARKEAQTMTEEVKQDNPLQAFVRTMAQAVGLTLADDAMVEGVKHLEALQEAAKATGKAPKDDTGSAAPSYPANENKVPYPSNITGQAPSDDKTKGGPIKTKADKMFEGAVVQQPETVSGSIAPQTRSSADGDTIVAGTPLYKSAVDEFLARLEAQAPNKAAVAAAKDALASVFDAPAAEDETAALTRDEVESMVMAGLTPIVEEVEKASKSLDEIRAALETVKAAKSEPDPALVELRGMVEDLMTAFQGIETRVTHKSAETRMPLLKSRVPVNTGRPARAESEEDATWSGSPFDIAANMG